MERKSDRMLKILTSTTFPIVSWYEWAITLVTHNSLSTRIWAVLQSATSCNIKKNINTGSVALSVQHWLSNPRVTCSILAAYTVHCIL